MHCFLLEVPQKPVAVHGTPNVSEDVIVKEYILAGGYQEDEEGALLTKGHEDK